MSKRQGADICQDDINRQMEYIQRVKELNAGRINKYSLKTYGCQMNENDSERLAGMLTEMGYVETEDINESDVIIYNTCVRENAS